jgi:hypothetical protein
MTTYEVEDYSVSNLGARLNRHSHQGDGYSEAKSHLSYFDEYFSSVGAQTILTEHRTPIATILRIRSILCAMSRGVWETMRASTLFQPRLR